MLVRMSNGCPRINTLHGVCYNFNRFSLLSAPTLHSFVERTDTYIQLTFDKVKEDTGQLIYKLEGAKGGTFVCSVGNQKCRVYGLSPGTKYALRLRACIPFDDKRCGEPSNALDISTLPGGKFDCYYIFKFSISNKNRTDGSVR